MTVTREDYAALLARKNRERDRLVKGPGELLAVFVAGKLVNPLNASAWGWQKRSRLAKTWKERTAVALFEAGETIRCDVCGYGSVRSLTPKRVHFLALTWNTMDSDGLQASLKPVRDSLVQCGVIHSDAPDSGHEFVYEQRIDRARRGVEIRVAAEGGGGDG